MLRCNWLELITWVGACVNLLSRQNETSQPFCHQLTGWFIGSVTTFTLSMPLYYQFVFIVSTYSPLLRSNTTFSFINRYLSPVIFRYYQGYKYDYYFRYYSFSWVSSNTAFRKLHKFPPSDVRQEIVFGVHWSRLSMKLPSLKRDEGSRYSFRNVVFQKTQDDEQCPCS
jgi:hypothetical protein